MALASRDVRALLECVRALYAPPQTESFAAHALAALRGLMSADTRGWNEVDFDARAVVDVYDDPPGVFGDLTALHEPFAKHFHEHPLLAVYTPARADGHSAAISDLTTARGYRKLGLYNEIYRRLATEDQIAIAFRRSSAHLLTLSFQRSARGFTAREHELLDLVRPHVAQAERNALALERARAAAATCMQALEALESGLVVVARDGRVRFASPGELARARRWFGASRRPQALPVVVEAWLAHVRDRCDPIDGAPEPLVREDDGVRMTVRVLPDPDRGQDVVVFSERRIGCRPERLRELGLTHRESEILAWVAEGKTNAEIARIVGARASTVKKHLEHVYAKLDVETRGAAARRALDAALRP